MSTGDLLSRGVVVQSVGGGGGDGGFQGSLGITGPGAGLGAVGVGLARGGRHADAGGRVQVADLG
jgi:hypothetical protein